MSDHPTPPHPDHTEIRPWGYFTVLDDEPGHKVKRIGVTPGQRLSYQLHHHRAEHWFIISGQATVTIDGHDRELGANQHIDIPARTAHRIANFGTDELVFIEVQHGTYFGEDDIERLQDDYGRTD